MGEVKEESEMSRTLIIDIETDGLLNEAEVIHCIVAKDMSKGKTYTFGDNEFCQYPLKKFKKLLYKANTIVLHNALNFDMPVLSKLMGIDYEIGYVENQDQKIPLDTVDGWPMFIFDSLIYSKLLNPDRRDGHSLEAWGKRLREWKGEFKPQNYKDSEGKPYTWKTIPMSKDMLDYCIQDVRVTEKLFVALKQEAGDWPWDQSFNLEKAVAEIIQRQEQHGFYFNKELAHSNLAELNGLLQDIETKVEALLPLRDLNKGEQKSYTPPKTQFKETKVNIPKNQFKKNGDHTKAMLNFAEKIEGTLDGTILKVGDKTYSLPMDSSEPFELDKEPSEYIKGFVDRIGGEWTGEFSFKFQEKEHTLPLPDEPIVDRVPTTLANQDEIKQILIKEGWNPIVFKEKDLSVNSKKEKREVDDFIKSVERYVGDTVGTPFEKFRREGVGLVDDTIDLKDFLLDHYRKASKRKYVKFKGEIIRVEKLPNDAQWLKPKKSSKQYPLKVYGMPTYTVDTDKTLCPNLVKLGKRTEYVEDIVKWLTYRHRRNAILSPNGTGFLANVREDGRIPTPADTLGCNTGRFQHKIVANIPRVTSLYGEPMRAMFCVPQGKWQIGCDADALEARVEGHYAYEFEGGLEHAEQLIQPKPNDIHSVRAVKLGISRDDAKTVGYALL